MAKRVGAYKEIMHSPWGDRIAAILSAAKGKAVVGGVAGNLIGRNNPIMSGVTKQFTNAELKVLADYVGSLPGQLQTVQRDRIRK